MKGSSRRFPRAFYVSATAIATAAITAAAVTASAAGAQPKPGASQIGPGYPPPGGIYSLFTNCPILNSLMAESPNITDPLYQGVSYAACVAGVAATGTLQIGNIVTPVVRPVNVQFGFVPPPNSALGGDNSTSALSPPPAVVPPPAGLSAMLVTKPDLIPDSLTTALGCPSTNKVVENICVKATNFGGKYQDVYGLAQNAGQLTNFGLTSWTQRIKIKLINPLLGNNCYIGTDQNPIVINPQISLAPGGQLLVKDDPNPAEHPDTEVLDITAATASDNTFFAPAVTGCGPSGGGVNAVPVDEALDTFAGLPAASGSNILALNGTFQVALSAPGEDSSLKQPQNNAKTLLSAFAASVGVPPASRMDAGRRISFAEMHHILGFK